MSARDSGKYKKKKRVKKLYFWEEIHVFNRKQ